MSLDIAKLENVHEEGRKTIARCPACAEQGMDTRGEHLVIAADGRFGCVVNPGAGGKAHRQRIFALVGKRPRGVPHIKVRSTIQCPMNTPAPLRIWDAWDGSFSLSRVQRNDDSDHKGDTQIHCTVGNGNLPSQASQIHKGAAVCMAPKVPRPPEPPKLEPVVHALDYGHPRFREPGNGEWVVGLYRAEDGSAAPLLLWMDTREDRFWDAARREHVKPPAWYLRLAEQPQIDAETGYPIINGTVCPF